ncbi:MAG: hypothetical protein V6Z89_21795, partial [Desulfobacter sp.]
IFIGVKTIPERHYHRHPSLGIFCWSPEKDGYARGNVKLSGKILTFSNKICNESHRKYSNLNSGIVVLIIASSVYIINTNIRRPAPVSGAGLFG